MNYSRELPPMSVIEAVSMINQTLAYAYPTLTVIGELANFKIAKRQWVYADIKDSEAKMHVFGTVHALPGPLEDGMLVEIVGEPRLHQQFGFSLNIRSIRAVGEGDIKKAQSLLQQKLEAEGLFASERKRYVAQAPQRVGLITSTESAAYADFVKVVTARWQDTHLYARHVQVQGADAVASVVDAVRYFNAQATPVDVLVIIRGGGSADDLAAFSSEQVTRAVAASRIPTVVAIGHEIDVSLAELAADMRASTPSNAAELLYPETSVIVEQLRLQQGHMNHLVLSRVALHESSLAGNTLRLDDATLRYIATQEERLLQASRQLDRSHPSATLKRGFALVECNGMLVRSVQQLEPGSELTATVQDGKITSNITKVLQQS